MLRGSFPQFSQRFNLPTEDLQAGSPRGGDACCSQGGTSLPVTPSNGLHSSSFSRLTQGGLLPLLEVPSRQDDCQSESVIKRNKFATFEKACSRVADGLYVSGEYVAKSRQVLREHGITHVVNCVGAMYPEYWRDDGVAYITFWLSDLPSEDILCVLYDAFEFIEGARSAPAASTSSSNGASSQPNGVLVHCSQGVSRSTTIVIGYLMWKLGKPYDEVYQTVRALRGVASPNIGFTCQLLQWQRRREQPPAGGRGYQIMPHCSSSPDYLVPKALQPQQVQLTLEGHDLDGSSCYVLHTAKQVYVWQGANCPAAHLEAGLRAARLLRKYEDAPAAVLVAEGAEPHEFMTALETLQLSSADSSRPSGTVVPLAGTERNNSLASTGGSVLFGSQ